MEVQLAKLVVERPTETFAVNTEMKPKEECKVIFTEREEKEKMKYFKLFEQSSIASDGWILVVGLPITSIIQKVLFSVYASNSKFE